MKLEQILEIELDIVKGLGVHWDFDDKDYFEFIKFHELYCVKMEEEKKSDELNKISLSK